MPHQKGLPRKPLSFHIFILKNRFGAEFSPEAQMHKRVISLGLDIILHAASVYRRMKFAVSV